MVHVTVGAQMAEALVTDFSAVLVAVAAETSAFKCVGKTGSGVTNSGP